MNVEDLGQGTRFNADGFDLLPQSGKVDPLPFVSVEARDLFVNPSKLSPGHHSGLLRFAQINAKDRIEYAKLVCRQLKSGKVDLAATIMGGGTVFGIGKKDSNKMREVWHGSAVSQAAVSPLPPPHLVSPSAFLGLEASAAAPLTISKRDGRCLFDQLRVPCQMRPYLGRPPVRVNDLIGTGKVSLYDIRRSGPSLGGVSGSTLLYPRSRVWPMGFSWSSYVAQSTMASVCASAGLCAHWQLADDLMVPTGPTSFGLATDDIIIFSSKPEPYVRSLLGRLDRAFVRTGVQKHAGKDVDCALNGTAVGVDLVNGLALFGNHGKLAVLIPAIIECLRRDMAAPLQIATSFCFPAPYLSAP